MALPILIIGEPGAGKTASIKTLPPETTYYVDCDKKGLNWRDWRKSYKDHENYFKTDIPDIALKVLKNIDQNEKFKHVKVIVIDTLNGLMNADEMRRSKEKGYDKWVDLAQCVYDLVDYALKVRDDLTVVFCMHSQTERDETGDVFTRGKTSGKKLDKIGLESKFNVVFLAKVKDGKHVFLTHNDGKSTVRTPFDAFEEAEIPNDLNMIIKALEDY